VLKWLRQNGSLSPEGLGRKCVLRRVGSKSHLRFLRPGRSHMRFATGSALANKKYMILGLSFSLSLSRLPISSPQSPLASSPPFPLTHSPPLPLVFLFYFIFYLAPSVANAICGRLLIRRELYPLHHTIGVALFLPIFAHLIPSSPPLLLQQPLALAQPPSRLVVNPLAVARATSVLIERSASRQAPKNL
jgi:hypothetical protein